MPIRRRASRAGLLLGLMLVGGSAHAEILRWVVIGDTGSNCTFVDAISSKETWVARAKNGQQTQVAEHLAAVVKQEAVRDIFFVGDNFYPHGLEQGPLGDACLELAFTAPYGKLLPPEHMHVIPGNHDYDTAGSIKRQLDLSGQIWSFYSRPALVHLVPGLIDVVLFDSAILVLDEEVRPKFRSELTARIRESTAPWLLLMAHHPLQTVGKHSYHTFLGRFNKNDFASSANRSYRRMVENAIVDSKRSVSLFVAGHDHSLQFIHEDEENPNMPDYYIVSGAGGKTSYVHSLNDERWGIDAPGFAVLEIDTAKPNVMHARFFDSRSRKEVHNGQIEIAPFDFKGTVPPVDAAGAGNKPTREQEQTAVGAGAPQ